MYLSCAKRRQRLLEALPPDTAALIPASHLQLRNGDVHHPFRQSSDFLYLTDFPEPEAVLLLRRGGSEAEQVLFCADKDPLKERWDGPITGPGQAQEIYGIPSAEPLSTLAGRLPTLMSGAKQVFYSRTTPGAAERIGTLLQAADGLGDLPQANLDPLLHEMRLIKDADEMERMRASAAIADVAHRRLMAAARPGMMEYELEAECLYEFARGGASGPAYPSIVGAGANACVLHYTANTAVLQDGDLVLVDAGCEYRGYASDITRTFPAGGTFSAEQKAIYQIVLQAQQRAIEAMRPGVSCSEPQQVAVQVIAAGLVELGILDGPVEQAVQSGAWKTYYMHRVGHWLGMDVHDVGATEVDGKSRPLQPGMVMTVEPGIYIDADSKVDACWRGIGVRIEDDVLVTESGAEVLGAAPPKTVAEVEALVGSL